LSVAPSFAGNPYGYAKSRPVGLFDPAGLFPIDSDGCRTNGQDSACHRPTAGAGSGATTTTTPFAGATTQLTPVAAPLTCYELPGGCAACAYAGTCAQDGFFGLISATGQFVSIGNTTWNLTKEYQQQAFVAFLKGYFPGIDAALRGCAQTAACRDTIDSALGASADANFNEQLRNSPYPETAILLQLGRLAATAVWGPYHNRYQP
jgi:hypothetical protein